MTDKQSFEMERIRMQPDGGISETRGIGGVLARLWRTIMLDLNISPNRFETLLSEFIMNARRQSDNRIAKLFTRGNIRREFERPTMTFKVFMKGLKLIKVKKVRIAVELEFNSGRKTLHQTSVDLGGNVIDTEDGETND